MKTSISLLVLFISILLPPTILTAKQITFKNLLDAEVGLYVNDEPNDALHAIQVISLNKDESNSITINRGEIWYIKIVETGTILVTLVVDDFLLNRNENDPWIITPSFIEFINYSEDVVDVFHITESNEQYLYGTLNPYDYYIQGTYVGHKWLLKSKTTGNVINYKATPGLQSVQYKEEVASRKRQTPVIDTSKKYNEVTFLAAHNAHCNKEDGWTYSQQSFTITKLLENYGVRALELDVYVRNNELLMCHGILGCGKTFESALIEINSFLDNNPEAIVTIFIESEKGWDPTRSTNTLFENTYRSSGVFDKIFWPNFDPNTPVDRDKTYGVNRGNNTTYVWPTLQTMINDNRRLLIFQDKFFGENSIQSINPFTWRYVEENDFSDQDHWYLLSYGCNEREQSLLPKYNIFSSIKRPILRLNHFPKFSGLTFYYRANRLGRLMERSKDCASEFGLVPNFIMIDYVETGGGLELVNLINKEVWTAQNPLEALQSLNLPRQTELKK